MIVVDTNVIAYLFIGGEKTPHARSTLLKDPAWAAPILWRSEFRNVLTMYLRQGRLLLPDAFELVREAESLLSGSEYQVESGNVLDLASSSRCSAYDCEFVALAQELGVPLVTSDKRILEDFPSIAVSMDTFSSN
ncbi:MAG: type II toxin-antitoxin system VapC family toxin [Candidatus Peribacteraceae bacterium]